MSINSNKTDSVLGQSIHEYLTKMEVESPLEFSVSYGDTSSKLSLIENQFRQIMQVIGLDTSNDHLVNTPANIASTFINSTFAGIDINAFPAVQTLPNTNQNDVIISRNIPVLSTCECHFTPIVGMATIAYVPNESVIESDKVNQIVEYFSKRPQTQDRLTSQIYHALQHILQTHDVAVSISARHYASGNNVDTITNKFGGSFSYNQSISASDFMATVLR